MAARHGGDDASDADTDANAAGADASGGDEPLRGSIADELSRD